MKVETLTLCPLIPGSPGVPGNPRAPWNTNTKHSHKECLTQLFSSILTCGETPDSSRDEMILHLSMKYSLAAHLRPCRSTLTSLSRLASLPLETNRKWNEYFLKQCTVAALHFSVVEDMQPEFCAVIIFTSIVQREAVPPGGTNDLERRELDSLTPTSLGNYSNDIKWNIRIVIWTIRE